MTLKLYIPPHMIDAVRVPNPSASANGEPLAPETYTEPGTARYSRRLPAGQDPVDVVFTVDHVIAPRSDGLTGNSGSWSRVSTLSDHSSDMLQLR